MGFFSSLWSGIKKVGSWVASGVKKVGHWIGQHAGKIGSIAGKVADVAEKVAPFVAGIPIVGQVARGLAIGGRAVERFAPMAGAAGKALAGEGKPSEIVGGAARAFTGAGGRVGQIASQLERGAGIPGS